MGFAWVILFPLGAGIIRLLSSTLSKALEKHRMVQIGALVTVFVAAAGGLYLANGHHFTLFRMLRFFIINHR